MDKIIKNKRGLELVTIRCSGYETSSENPFPGDSFKKYKIKTNPNMCILMYFKLQSDQPRITRNALKSQKVKKS